MLDRIELTWRLVYLRRNLKPFLIDLDSHGLQDGALAIDARVRAPIPKDKNLEFVTIIQQNEFYEHNSTFDLRNREHQLWIRNSMDFFAFWTMRYNATRNSWILSRHIFHLLLVSRLHSATLRKLQKRPLRRCSFNLVPHFLALRRHVSFFQTRDK